MNTLQGQQRELSSDGCAEFNAWWSCFSHQFQFNTQIAYEPTCTCYILIIGTDIKFNHTNSAYIFFGTLTQPFHFRQWLRVCAMKTGTSYFGNLFPTCQLVLCHACHIWYSLWPKSLTHNHSTRAGPVRIQCVMTGVRQEVKGLCECPEALEIFQMDLNKANLRDLIAVTGLLILLKLDSNHRFFSHVTLKFDWWPQKIIGHLFYITSSFVHHLKPLGEFELQLLSGNAQFGSKSAIFCPLWPWNSMDDLEKQ